MDMEPAVRRDVTFAVTTPWGGVYRGPRQHNLELLSVSCPPPDERVPGPEEMLEIVVDERIVVELPLRLLRDVYAAANKVVTPERLDSIRESEEALQYVVRRMVVLWDSLDVEARDRRRSGELDLIKRVAETTSTVAEALGGMSEAVRSYMTVPHVTLHGGIFISTGSGWGVRTRNSSEPQTVFVRCYESPGWDIAFGGNQI